MPERIIIFLIVQLTVCTYALWQGGAPERWTAWMMAGACVLTPATAFVFGADFSQVSAAPVVLDVALLAAFVLLALRANRFWPMWIAALQLLVIAIHAVRGFDPSILPSVYNRTIGKFAYPMMALLVIGTFRHHRRKRDGDDLDWSPLRW